MSSAFCQQHEARAAVGICVHCARPLCSDCITKIDGINHCRACLEARAAATPPAVRGALGPLQTRVLLGAGASTLWLLTWLTLSVLLPGAP